VARLFDDAASQYLKYAAQTITAFPFTVSLRFYVDADALVQMLFTQSREDPGNYYTYLAARMDSAGDPLRATVITNGVGANAVTTNAISADSSWHHAVGIYTASGVTAILNADFANEGNAGHAVAYPGGMDNTLIAAIEDNASRRNYLSGAMAEVAVWSAALTDPEVSILYEGVSPLLVRPQSLVLYVPLIRDDDEDIVGGLSFTANGGPTIAAHPGVFYPGAVLVGQLPSGGPPPSPWSSARPLIVMVG